MKKEVSINIVIPVYNTEKYLNKCLSSLLNQTFNDWKAIIVDDGSTDGSADICKNFCKKYPEKFKYCYKSHGGPGSARNYGIEHCECNAQWWYFLDSDDFLSSTMLEKMVSAASNNIDMVICGYVRCKGKRKEVFNCEQGVFDKKEICSLLLKGDAVGDFVWNKLFAYKLFDTLRFPEDRLYEDVATVYKAVLCCADIFIISEPLYHYICHKGSVISSDNVDYLLDLRNAVADRNANIVKSYPDLKSLATLNELKKSIYIWNNLCGKSSRSVTKKYSFILEFIKSNYKIYDELDSQYRTMANAIRSVPNTYVLVMSMLKRINGIFK